MSLKLDRAKDLAAELRVNPCITREQLVDVVLMLLDDYIAKLESAEMQMVAVIQASAPVVAKPRPAPTAEGTNQVIAAYIVAWQTRYQTKARPAIQPMIGGLKVLLKDYSAAELVQLVQAYCQMTDEWFEKKKHDFETFRQNVGKVAISLDAGEDDPGSELARAMTAIKGSPRRLT